MEAETVDGVARGVDGFGPKDIRSLVLIKHGSCHLNESSILPLRHSILLWSVWSGELMLDAFLLKKLFNLQILELGPIIAPYILTFSSNSF